MERLVTTSEDISYVDDTPFTLTSLVGLMVATMPVIPNSAEKAA